MIEPVNHQPSCSSHCFRHVPLQSGAVRDSCGTHAAPGQRHQHDGHQKPPAAVLWTRGLDSSGTLTIKMKKWTNPSVGTVQSVRERQTETETDGDRQTERVEVIQNSDSHTETASLEEKLALSSFREGHTNISLSPHRKDKKKTAAVHHPEGGTFQDCASEAGCVQEPEPTGDTSAFLRRSFTVGAGRMFYPSWRDIGKIPAHQCGGGLSVLQLPLEFGSVLTEPRPARDLTEVMETR